MVVPRHCPLSSFPHRQSSLLAEALICKLLAVIGKQFMTVGDLQLANDLAARSLLVEFSLLAEPFSVSYLL
jgi:hypothetical protein